MNSELKLRNKKTGKPCIVHIGTSSESGNIHLVADDYITKHVLVYETLAELNEDWEDYKPTEPLIKDEKIRKVVRAWAENIQSTYGFDKIKFYRNTKFNTFQVDTSRGEGVIAGYDIADIDMKFSANELEDGKEYTLEELCGEEEE